MVEPPASRRPSRRATHLSPQACAHDLLEPLGRLAPVAATAALALAAVALPASVAGAADLPAPEIAWVGQHVVANGSDAYIQAKFRCYGGETGTHLWASVKKGGPTRPPRARA